MTHTYQDIEYTLRMHPRAKGVKIAVDTDGHVVVTRSRRVSQKTAHAFVVSRAAWIRKAVAELDRKKQSAHKAIDYFTFPADTPAARKKARQIITERLRALNDEHFNFMIKRVSIRHTRSRWGSCSVEGNLNFSYKVAFLPEPLRDYVIIHELAHLKYMNHSLRFWALVKSADSEYSVHRKTLRQYTIV